ncbi:MAG: hypothetical protein ACTHWA_09925 [Arachnia sp.]
MRPESTHAGHRVSWPALVALILVPLLAVAAFITLGGNGNDDRVSAAVVNLDEAVELDGQLVPLGRQLAAAILERDGDNIGWTLADSKNASEGLQSGEYSTVVTIPPEFSAAATSFSDNDADTARQATVAVRTSQNSPVTDAAVAQEIARLASATINEQLTEGYLDGIYVGFNEVGEQFTTIVDGATQLSDGASELAEGTDQASDGAVQLSDGLMTLSDNSQELVGGGEQLAEGADQLAAGVGQLVPGADALASGSSDLADGVGQLVPGANQLSTGASELATGVSGLATGASGVASGAAELNAGISQFAQQTPQLADGVDQLASGAEPLLGPEGIPQFAEGAKQALEGVGGIKFGIDQVIDGILNPPAAEGDGETTSPDEGFAPLITGSRALADGLTATSVGVADLSGGINEVDATLQAFASGTLPPPAQALAGAAQIKAGYVCPEGVDAETCVLLQQAFEAGVDGGFTAGFRAGTGTGSAALNSPDPETGTSLKDGAVELAEGTAALAGTPATDGQSATGAIALADGVEGLPAQIQEGTEEQLGELIGGLQELSEGTEALITLSQPLVDNADGLGAGSTQLLSGINELNTQVAALPAGVNQLSVGSSQLAGGASQLSDGVSQLSTGASALAGGASQLAGGVTELSQGADQLSDGASQLANGVGQLDGGASDLAAGVSEFVVGVRQYTGGVDSAAEGAVTFSDGIVELDDGTSQLAEGLETFATELAAGAEEVPSYTPDAREKLSTVVTNPVAQSDGLVENNRAAVVALALVAMLWLASLATFVVARAIPSNVLTSSASNATLWIRTMGVPMLIAAAEGLVFGLMGGIVLELGVGRLFGLMGLLAVLGAVFVLVNHALTAWLGNVGRGISILLLLLSVAMGLTSATPGIFDAITSFSPVQNALLMIRTWISEGTGMAGYIGGMLLMAVISLILSVFAISSRRKLTARQFRSRVAGQA